MKGVDFIISVNTGTEETPVLKKIGGQRGGSLNRSAESIDKTSKDSNGWKESGLGLKEWSIEGDGLWVENCEGYDALETAFMQSKPLLVDVSLPSGTKYKGTALLTDFPLDMPYDDEVTYSVTLSGTGPLTVA